MQYIFNVLGAQFCAADGKQVRSFWEASAQVLRSFGCHKVYGRKQNVLDFPFTMLKINFLVYAGPQAAN